MQEYLPRAPGNDRSHVPVVSLQQVSTAKLVIALGILGIVGTSIGLGVGFFMLLDATSFLASNVAGDPERKRLFASAMLGAAGGVLLWLGLLWGRRGGDRVCLAGDLLSPLCLAGLVPVVLSYRTWVNNRLTFLIVLSAMVLIAERLFEHSIKSVPSSVAAALRSLDFPLMVRRHAPTALVLLGALGYTLYFSHYTLLNHRRFGTSGFDLGINVNFCYNALHGQPFRATVLFGPDGGSMIAGHAIYAVFLWLPFFALKPGAEILLIYQSVVAGIAAVPLYFFARTQLPRWSAAAVALMYLLFAPLHGPNFYDFHELMPALPWHFLLYFLIATRRMKLAMLVVPILWAHREDVAVGLTVLGVFLVATGARPRFGIALSLCSTVWFIIDKFVIMPAAGPWFFANFYKDLIPAGQEGYGPVVQTIISNPAYFVSTLLKEEKLVYFLHLFAPLVFLPLRHPLLALLAMPGFFFTLMTTDYHPTLSIAFQYTTHWIPYLFAAVVLSLRALGQRFGSARRQGALCALVIGITCHSVNFGAVFQHDTFEGGFARITFEESPADKKLYAGFKKLADMIPERASVAATETEISHVAARMNAYTLRGAAGDPDYLLIRANGVMDRKSVQDTFDRNDYGLLAQYEHTFYLFKKGYQSADTRAAMSRLGFQKKSKKHHG